MRPDVPPDFLPVVDAACSDQQIDVTLEIAVRVEVIRNVSTRELFEDLGAIRFESGIVAHPERRRSRKREDVRQEVSRSVHDVNRALAVSHANVYVQSEDQ